jgi:hypothetical protein
MAQAESKSTTSRRTLLATGAALAAVPAAVLATKANATDDPIFAAIATHRASREVHDQLEIKCDECEDRLGFGYKHPPKVVVGQTRSWTLTYDDDSGKTHKFGSVPIEVSEHNDIDHYICEQLKQPGADENALTCRRALLHEELSRLEWERSRQEEPLELKAIRDRRMVAVNAEYDAEQALIATKPTTLQGTLAFLDYVLALGPENIDEVQDWIAVAAQSLRAMT